MGMPTSESFLVVRSGEPRTRTALLLESIALRHQIACRAQPNSSPVLSPLGSAVLDILLALVAPMARQPDHCPALYGLALAP
jgi:hypothetical protein